MYAIYHKDFIPEAMLAKYGNPARYIGDMLALFCETQENVTGTPADEIIDVAGMGFNPDGDSELTGLTGDELKATVTQMLSLTPTGKEIQITKPQGRWLYANDDRFKPNTDMV